MRNERLNWTGLFSVGCMCILEVGRYRYFWPKISAISISISLTAAYPVQSYWHFSEIQDGGSRHLGFSAFLWIWPFRRVDSVVCGFCVIFDLNIGCCHWDRRTYASDLHLMTSNELTSGFHFWSVVISTSAWCIFPCEISYSSPELLIFFRNSRWRPPPSWIFSLCEFGHSDVLAVWYLCSVPNLVQI